MNKGDREASGGVLGQLGFVDLANRDEAPGLIADALLGPA
jgi:hypothetical protein